MLRSIHVHGHGPWVELGKHFKRRTTAQGFASNLFTHAPHTCTKQKQLPKQLLCTCNRGRAKALRCIGTNVGEHGHMHTGDAPSLSRAATVAGNVRVGPSTDYVPTWCKALSCEMLSRATPHMVAPQLCANAVGPPTDLHTRMHPFHAHCPHLSPARRQPTLLIHPPTNPPPASQLRAALALFDSEPTRFALRPSVRAVLHDMVAACGGGEEAAAAAVAAFNDSVAFR